MEMPRSLSNLIAYANTIDKSGGSQHTQLSAMVVTPTEQLPLILPQGYAKFSLYAVNCADDFRIKASIQPGVYQNKVLPNKDNLYIEVTERKGLTQTMKRFRAVPLGDSNPQMIGTSTQLADLGAKDNINMVTVSFQLMETGYAILKNVMVSDRHLMSSLDNVLHYQLTKYGKQLQLIGEDAWRGVDIERPIDNPREFKQIIIGGHPAAVPYPQLARFLQNHEEFGIYSKGLGAYYRKGMWMIYPLFKVGRYEKARAVLNIYRLPEDVFPTLEATHFTQGKVTTILSTGKAKHIDGADIKKQNQGSGKRIISADTVMGEVGAYYGNGQAVATRQDSLSEYQTSVRGSGEERAPFLDKPTNNLCKHLSENAFNEGTMETIQWNNSNHDLLVPAMPVRFYYMSGDNTLKYKEGTLLAARTEFQKDSETTNLAFRQHSALSLFLNNQEMDAE